MSSPPVTPDPASASQEPSGDALAAAQRLIWAGVAMAIASLLAVIAGLVFGPTGDQRSALMSSLPAERLAFAPAGRIDRVPASHPAIQTHFAPGLARLAPDIDRLLFEHRLIERRPLSVEAHQPEGDQGETPP